MIPQLLFFYFAGVTVLTALVAVISPNLVMSALSLLLTFVHIAGLYILLNAEFIAAIQIIIYAGAILVLYLFALMLFNAKTEPVFLHRQYPAGIFLGLVLFGLMILSIFRSEILGQPGTLPNATVGQTQQLGMALYTDFVFPFEIASFILLVAMFGAILLAGRHVRRKNNGPA
ncbi:MAG: NADH-quinone oxidoreductase subunit J [Nitrospirota bacterium]